MRKSLVVLALLLSVNVLPDARAEQIVDERTEYYEIRGSTPAELREQMTQNGYHDPDGKVFDGNTNVQMKQRYSYRTTVDGCRIDGVAVFVRITITFPKWMDYEAGSRWLQETWDRYLANLGVHEAGHRAIALASAGEIERIVPSVEERKTCREVDELADGLVAGILEGMKRKNEKYDRDTQGGYRQGAHFP